MRTATATLILVMAMTFIVTFDGAAVQMALPVLQRELGVGVHRIQWIMTSFLIMATASLLPAGRAGDLHGHERAWRLGALCFAATSALCTMAPGLWWLVGARALQGASAALVAANSVPLLVDAAPPGKQAETLGLSTVAIALGLVLGPPLGAVFTAWLSWRLVFALGALAGLGAWLTSRNALPVMKRRTESLDLTGGVLVAVALGTFLSATSFGDHWGWTAAETLLLFGSGLLAGVLFVLRQRQTSEPLLDLGLFKSRMFLSGAVTSLCSYAALFALTLTMPFFLFVAQQRHLVSAGLLVGIVPLFLSITAPLAGRLADRIGSRLPCTAGALAITVGLVLLQWAHPQTHASLLMIAMALTGAGLGAFQAPNDAAVLTSLASSERGVGMAMLNAIRNLGMTVGLAAAATALDVAMRHGVGSLQERATAGFHVAMIIGTAFAATGSVAAALRPGWAAVARSRTMGPQGEC